MRDPHSDRQPSDKSPSIALINLGCPKNLVDAERVLGGLKDDVLAKVLHDTAADIYHMD